jgi:hypothetical protein
LHSHLIPVEELKAGDYEGLSEMAKAQKIKNNYEAFLAKRAAYIIKAVDRLTQGEDIDVTYVMQ